ncbi:TRP-domain-containing protein [Trichodelitschia bisporula]|uniref:TRP-domain-containing protein n=1 Tax=Trichodelitschia bisporula TaxID=703511 RepID=A0A6G1I2W3_9PEZI|nr:TRP-domain-containing protein [Trichodelitschia bisporula]
MKVRWRPSNLLASLLILGALPVGVLSGDVLETSGFSTCGGVADITVQRMNIQYNRNTNKIVFDVAGTSSRQQKVKASLTVTAYGKEVYSNHFDPCQEGAKIDQLCPVPEGNFAAKGEQDIPTKYANMIPAIAFNVPDLDGMAKLELTPADGGAPVACIQSVVGNGKTMSVVAVPYVAAGIAGAALVVSGLSALAAGGATGAAAPSPSFSEVVGWFQSMALNGMLSVQYPSVYRSFAQNFAFSGGLIQWESMQQSIDSFRNSTGGNLTTDSVAFLKKATLVYGTENGTLAKRDLATRAFNLFAREVAVSQNTNNPTNATEDSKTMHFVHGIQGYAEKLMIPQSNTFMTILLIFAVIIGAIVVGILLFKVILETWALFGSFPKRLTSFRKRYWWIMAKSITNLILLLYGVWTLYCVYQFTRGDSWAAKLLAGVTLALFTLVLAYFAWKIWSAARKFKKAEGDASGLFEDKETWRKYSLFYENYKKGYWWLFLPAIIYMFAKGVVIAAGDGHGMFQTAGQLIIESIMLVLLLWSRPYTLKSGNWINITIQVVRVLSVLCILVFVEQLGISQTPKTITGVVLIVMQSVLTGLLAILIAVNALIVFCKANPHRKARKEAEKKNRDMDALTPLDARNSLLLSPEEYKSTGRGQPPITDVPTLDPKHYKSNSQDSYQMEETSYRAYHRPAESRDRLLSTSHSNEQVIGRDVSPQPSMRAPLLPEVDLGYRRGGY